jgi:hypothetical protein
MYLQCLPVKKLWARGVRGRSFTEHCAYCYLGCLLALCGKWLYDASSLTMWWFPDNFFCLVCGPPCYTLYTLSRKKKESLGLKFHGGIGSTWGQFLHRHAEWVETRDLTLENFDSHLRIKVMAL